MITYDPSSETVSLKLVLNDDQPTGKESTLLGVIYIKDFKFMLVFSL